METQGRQIVCALVSKKKKKKKIMKSCKVFQIGVTLEKQINCMAQNKSSVQKLK